MNDDIEYQRTIESKMDRLSDIQGTIKRLKQDEIKLKKELKDLNVQIGDKVYNFLYGESFKVMRIWHRNHRHPNFKRPSLHGYRRKKNGEWGKRCYFLCDDWVAQ